MKALLSIGYGCVLAALTPGLCRATMPDDDPPRQEVAKNAPENESSLPARTGSAASPATPPTSAPVPSPPASENVTINLINRLVQRGVLTKDDADELIKQAEADAAKAREQANAATRGQGDRPPAPDTSLFPPQVVAPSTNVVAPPPTEILPAGDSLDEVRVPYVPETVRRQIADEVRDEVMQKARDENWATPRTLPDWTLRFTPFADFRLRY